VSGTDLLVCGVAGGLGDGDSSLRRPLHPTGAGCHASRGSRGNPVLPHATVAQTQGNQSTSTLTEDLAGKWQLSVRSCLQRWSSGVSCRVHVTAEMRDRIVVSSVFHSRTSAVRPLRVYGNEPFYVLNSNTGY
jgi:hypothetical protein